MTVYQRPQAIDSAKLDKLAEVAIRIGLNLQPGQDLFLTAPVAALPLVRRIAEHAYKAGAGIVTPLLSDEEITLARYRNAPDASFDKAPGWLYQGVAKAFSENTARLAIVGDNPMLLADEDPAKVGRAAKANSLAYQPALERSPASTSTGISSPIRARPGRSRFSRTMPRRSRLASWPRRFSPPRASMKPIRSRRGRRIMRRCAAGAIG